MPLCGWACSEAANDRPEPASAVGGSAMRAAAAQSIVHVLPAGAGERHQPGVDATDRRAVSGDAV